MAVFQSYREAVDLLKRSKRPLFVLLKDIDADAIGSSVALALALMGRGLKPEIISCKEIPHSLKFICPNSIPFRKVEPGVDLSSYDLAIIGDSGHLQRTGLADELNAARQRDLVILNIDHHHVHQAFGTVNMIDTTASATAEIVYDLIKLGGWPLTPDMATAILAGITADTDAFSNAATTVRSLEIAAHCYARGADSRRVVKELYHGKELNALKLWGVVLSRLVKNKRWGIVSTIILQEDLKALDITDEATEGVADFMNTISDMKAALILKELPGGEIRASLRTTRDDVDVSKLAQIFGGGGHKKAAGFTVAGTISRTDGGWRVKV